MMFGRTIIAMRLGALAMFLAAALMAVSGPARAGEPYAVVPTAVIYPGQALDPALLKEVEVTNPAIRQDYVHSLADLDGMVATHTLLPGRVIPSSSVRLPYAVERGKPVRLVYSDGSLTISATGMPLQNAAAGSFIRVRNTESGVTVSGTVGADGTVEVATR